MKINKGNLKYETEMALVVTNAVSTYTSRYSIFCCSICSTSSNCSNIVEGLNDIPSTRYFVVDKDPDLLPFEYVSVIIFIPQVNMVLDEFDRVRNYRFFHKRAKFYFVFCGIVNNEIHEEIFDTIWNTEVFDFVFVYQIQNTDFNVVIYNGFVNNGKIVKLLAPYDNLFPNKLQNMYGHTLDVLVYDDFPRSTINRSATHKTAHMFFLHFFAKLLNATFKYHKTDGLSTSMQLMQTGNYDFCLIEKFVDKPREGIEFSYPFRMDSIMALIPPPKLSAPYKLMLSIFTYKYLVLFFLLPILISFCHSKLSWGKLKIYDLLFNYFGLIYGIPVMRFERKKSPLFVLWLWYSLVIGVFISCSILANVFQSNYDSGIKNLDDLKNTENSLFGGPMLSYLSQEKLSRKVITLDKNIFNKLILEQNQTDSVFLAPSSYLESMLNLLERNGRQIKFKILNDPIVLGIDSFMIKKMSPYRRPIDHMVFMNLDFKYKRTNPERSIPLYQHKSTVLTFRHFYGSFIILFIGYYISAMAFLAELLLSRFHFLKRS